MLFFLCQHIWVLSFAKFPLSYFTKCVYHFLKNIFWFNVSVVIYKDLNQMLGILGYFIKDP